jgi:opacity protein-like surface antigen
MRLVTLVGLAFLLFATAVNAQIPTKGNVYFGYSYARADLAPGGSANLNGWDASLEGKVLPLLGIVADLGGNYGGQQVSVRCPEPCAPVRENGSAHTFLFGPRMSVSAGKFTPFAHVLIGAAHVGARGSGFSSSDTSFATALGGGLDYKLVKGVAWRFQADYLQTRLFSTTQDNFRFTTGLVFRF